MLSRPSEALLRAGAWFLHSGIQEPGGGVSRYYLTAEQRKLPVSAEITGYAASLYIYLFQCTGQSEYLEAAQKTARFLTGAGWNRELNIFPFECGDGAPAYFFDCGVIVRGLLAVWRRTREAELLEVAAACGRSMARDFLTPRAIHPIVSLPDRRPWPYEKRWSRSPGCFQLKAAMAWRNLAEATGERTFSGYWEKALELALESEESFLPGTPDRDAVMDRLHAYCYFLEGLLSETGREECARALGAGIERTAGWFRELAPRFARSDVPAQLVRVRLYADALGAVPLDRAAAEDEVRAVQALQYSDRDARLDGGFCFGHRAGEPMPFANPVSTAFCAQALEMWRQYQAGGFPPDLEALV